MDHDHHHHHHDHHDHNVHEVAGSVSSQQDLIMAKVVAMVVLGLVSFVIGVLPVKLASWFHFGDDLLSGKRARAHALVISLLLCFGGGVLLYTTFVHLQPEVRQGFESLRRAGKLPDNDVQLSELVFCAGFFLVYIVEELVHLILDGRASKHDQDKDMDVVHRTMSLRRCPANSGSSVEDGHHHHHSNIGGPNQMIPRAILAPGSPVKPTQLETVSGMTQAPRKSITSSTEGLINGSNLGSTASFPVPDLHHHHNHSHLHHHNHQAGFGVSVGSKPEEKVMSKSISGFLTVLALSFHAVFEGLAVGLESSPNNVWYLFGAVATHKFVIAFCVGIELVTSRTRLSLILTYVATFAAVSPVGIAAGLLLGADPSAGQGVAEVVLQGMAAGTLLYVVFFEILQRERANTQSGVCQLLAIMAGFGAMLALGMTSSHAHSHGGHAEGLDGLEHDDDGATTPAPLAAALHAAEALALKLSR